MVDKLVTDINMILFLLHSAGVAKYGCNTMHAQIFSKNLMIWGFLNSNFLCYFANSQTMIGANHFPDFLDIFFIF